MNSSEVSAGDYTKASQYNNLRKDALPSGSVISYPLNSAPTGFLICNGQAVSRTTYSVLFGLLAEVYGAGDGVNTFNVPDLRDRFPLYDGVSALGAVGTGLHTIIEAELPIHNHVIYDYSHYHTIAGTGAPPPPLTKAENKPWVIDICSGLSFVSNDGAHDHTGATVAAGGGVDISILPSYFAICYLIKI
jgi:microcystin-dependent protein